MSLRLNTAGYREQLEVLEDSIIRKNLSDNNWSIKPFLKSLSDDWLQERKDMSLKVFRVIPKKMRSNLVVEKFINRLMEQELLSEDDGSIYQFLLDPTNWKPQRKKFLLNSGALESKGVNGETPLLRAVREENWDLVKRLLGAGVTREPQALLALDRLGMSHLVDGKSGCSGPQMKGIVEKISLGQWDQISVPKKLSSPQKERLLTYIELFLDQEGPRPLLWESLKQMHLGKPCRKMRSLLQWLACKDLGAEAELRWAVKQECWDLVDHFLENGMGTDCQVEWKGDFLSVGQVLFQYAPYQVAQRYAIGEGKISAGYDLLQLDLERERFQVYPSFSQGEQEFADFWLRLLEVEDPRSLHFSEFGLFDHLQDTVPDPWLRGLSVLTPVELETLARHFEGIFDQPADLCWASPPLVALLIAAPGGFEKMKDNWRHLLPLQEGFGQEHCMFAWVAPVVETTLSDEELAEFLERDIDVTLALLPHFSSSFRKEVEKGFLDKFDALNYVGIMDLQKKIELIESGSFVEDHQKVFNQLLQERQKASRLLAFFRSCSVSMNQEAEMVAYTHSLSKLILRLGSVALKASQVSDDDDDREIFAVLAELYPKHTRNLNEVKGRLFQRVYDRQLFSERDLGQLGLRSFHVNQNTPLEELKPILEDVLLEVQHQRKVLGVPGDDLKVGWKPPELDRSECLDKETGMRCLLWIEDQLQGMLNRAVSESLVSRLQGIERLWFQVIVELVLLDRNYYEKLTEDS